MIDQSKVAQAVREFMENPTWKEIFMNAPGGAMERLAISFYFSKFHDEFTPEDFSEYRALREEYEKSMNEEDLQYLIDNNDKPTAIKHYQELLDKIHGGQQPTGTLRFEKEETSTDGTGGEQADAPEAASGAQESPSTEGGEVAPPTGEKPPEGQETAMEAKPEETDGEKDEQKPDEKYDTALSVALNYLQNEKKKK